MNYVGGFFLKIIKNEDIAFRYYVSLVENQMNEIFNERF